MDNWLGGEVDELVWKREVSDNSQASGWVTW